MEVLDPLEASALTVSDGDSTAVMIAADMLGIEGTAFSSVLRSRIASAAGIADNAVFLHCTHTHTGPGAGVADEGRCHLFDGTSEYNELLAESLSNVAKMAVSIGDSLAFAGVPGEPFTEIGRGVKSASPFAVTLFSCLTNGSCGYFPVKSAYAEGGYEARSSIFGTSVADDIIAGQLRLLDGIRRAGV